MKVKFDFSYAEISTIYDSLCKYLNDLVEECERFGKPVLYKESVAFNFYCQFREVLDEYEK